MLEELKNIDVVFGKQELIYFIQNILGTKTMSRKDISIMLQHAPGGLKYDIDAIISYCKSFLFIEGSLHYKVSSLLINDLDNTEELNNKMIEMTVLQLFQKKILLENNFSFSPKLGLYRFRHETLLLGYSGIRDVLTSQGFLILQRQNNTTNFYVNKKHQWILAKYLRANKIKLRLDELKKELEYNEKAGNMAEEFVMQFEKNRLAPRLSLKILRVSEIDVGAGYDIASFESNDSCDYDCFIEVKAISSIGEFFLSKNEFETAKILGSHYKLYLIDLSQIKNIRYKPEIIVNPAQEIMLSEYWTTEIQSYKVRKIIQ